MNGNHYLLKDYYKGDKVEIEMPSGWRKAQITDIYILNTGVFILVKFEDGIEGMCCSEKCIRKQKID